jgi:hypothetical protein
MSIRDQAMRSVRQPQEEVGRKPVFIARAKVGPRDGNWAAIGAVWERKKGEGFVLKLHTLPISRDWDGLVVLKAPSTPEEESGDPPQDE